MLWGFSEALDFNEEYKKYVTKNDLEPLNELNILLFGSSDPRHILRTLARCYQYTNVKVNFFVLEGCPALIARQMILLSIALEPSHLLTSTARTHLFMDVYGNALIRSSSMGYINSKANHLIKCVTDLKFNEKMQPIFDLSYLKFIERDCLENVFSFWREKKGNAFDVSGCWIHRVQKHLRDRFDSRQGAYDWDHQMRLKDNGAHQICSQEYKHWRETGVAFTFPEYRQSHANKTFALQPSKPYADGGYLGDITVGPFCSFGLTCSDDKMLRSTHGQNEYRATDITERNLFEAMYEIEKRKPLDSESLAAIHKLGMTKIDNGKLLNTNQQQQEFNENDLKKFNEPLIPTNPVKISFLSMNDARALVDGNKFNDKFDVIFVGRNYFPIMKTEFSHIFKKNALVMFETVQLSTERKPEIANFLQNVKDLAKKMHLKAITNFHINLPLPLVKFTNAHSKEELEKSIE